MAIKFLNIKSGEVRVAETEPHIAAMWASSDHSPNITQGQDFGWRLAPEVVVEMKKIKQDFNTLSQIASRLQKNVDEVGEPDILLYISRQYEADNAPVAEQADYESDYDDEVRRLSRAQELERQKDVLNYEGKMPPAAGADVMPQSGLAQGVPAVSQSTDTQQTSNPLQPKEVPTDTTDTATTTKKPEKPEKPEKPAR